MSSSPPTPIPALLRPPSYHPAAVEWTPGAPPRYVFFNPMHIINLQDRTKTFGVRLVEKIKAISEKWFTHVLLLLFLVIYTVIGALVFQWLEGPLETGEKLSIIRTRELVIDKLWSDRNKTEEEWRRLAYQRMKEYEGQVEQHFKSKAPSDSEVKVWSFWGSMFYCGTVFTTIGYGNIVPATKAGQAVTIIYAFIGIPFLLMVLADLGRLFTRCIKAIFYYIKLFYHTGKCRKARRMGRRATAVPAQYMSLAWNKMPYMVYQQKRMRKRGSVDISTPADTDVESGKENDEKEKDQNEKNNHEKFISSTDIANNKTNIDEDNDTEMDVDQEMLGGLNFRPPTAAAENIDEEFNLPVSLAVILLVAYMMLGACVFTLWENWTFFESFYFVFISMSTIGFGDYVPDHPMYMMATFIYLLFGLALTSMCINIVQEKLSATFELAKMRIGTTIGLDASMLIAQDMPVEKSETPESQKKNKDSIKSRRGSKAVHEKKEVRIEGDEEKDGILKRRSKEDQVENGVEVKNSKNLEVPEARN